MCYTHLTQDERYQIFQWQCAGLSNREIAGKLGRSPSTLSRELKRNAGPGGWNPAHAQQRARQRQKASRNARRIDPALWQAVLGYLHLDLSPQQALGRLALESGQPIAISHETVYRHIEDDRRRGGQLYRCLRQGKRRRQRRCYPSSRGVLAGRIGIEHRPAIVAQRGRLGDWEGDTMIGGGRQGVLVTLVERVSRLTLAARLPSRQAPGVAAAIVDLLTPYRRDCHTLTFDNGLEFAEHPWMAARLRADVYFARPYHSWERGANENANGLLRQYFPKTTNFLQISQAALQDAIDRLNHRPRRCLGYRTPYEVFHNLQVSPLDSTQIALRG